MRMLRASMLALVLAACGGGGGTTTEAPATDPSPAAESIVSRVYVVACLSDSGLEPEDSGLRIIGSAGTDVEAIGVHLDEGGRALLFVFDDDASGQVDYVADNFATGYGDVSATGNVVVAYESSPSDAERAQIDPCLTA